ncbi:MAG: fibro-slime domain-containing protein [Candidatus Saccharibacteria bacterium]|nr:fibro-slime domain-containing protein [Candidatus Saccharibacteria bacterium]
MGLKYTSISQIQGVPTHWENTSIVLPNMIEADIVYFDQLIECETDKGTGNRMFEYQQCGDKDGTTGQTGLQQGVLKNHLGVDGLPIPTYTSLAETTAAGFTYRTRGITGHDPVLPTDNFYQWFHEVPGKSYRYDKLTSFRRLANQNKYVYGGTHIFPLDDIIFKDVAQGSYEYQGHNYSFTAHLSVPMRMNLTGNEVFEFSGDDDVWVFLNGHLILDIGGTHQALPGNFRVNKDGTVTSTVADEEPVTIHTNLHVGEVVNLDFFYAERNTVESNTLITISGMEWPISADSTVTDRLVDGRAIEYVTEVENDTAQPVNIERMAAFIDDKSLGKSGFLELVDAHVQYSYTPDIEDSWVDVKISSPTDDHTGFKLETPVVLGPNKDVYTDDEEWEEEEENTTSRAGAILAAVTTRESDIPQKAYFRFYYAPSTDDVDVTATVSYYTADKFGDTGVTYDIVSSKYTLTPSASTNPNDPTTTNPTEPGGNTDNANAGEYVTPDDLTSDDTDTKNIPNVPSIGLISEYKPGIAFSKSIDEILFSRTLLAALCTTFTVSLLLVVATTKSPRSVL